jgi:5-methylcytosine-specific restriction protein B
MREANRIKIIAAVKDIFGVDEEVPTSFESIPVLNPQNATFYKFIDIRGENDIDDLWKLFESALAYADTPDVANRDNLSKYFDIIINQKGNGNSKVTMGLYWISPRTFLNLDIRNTWYIYESGKLPDTVVSELPEIESKISAEKYFVIVEKLRAYLNSEESTLKDFKELSFEAWKYSSQMNEEKKKSLKGSGLADDDVETVHVWLYTVFDDDSWEECKDKGQIVIGVDKIGNLRDYSSKEEIRQALLKNYEGNSSRKNQALMAWNFANTIKIKDVIYAKKGQVLLGKGIVSGGYFYDEERKEYKNVLNVNWVKIQEQEHPGKAVAKRLTDITAYTDYVEKLNALYEVADDEEDVEDEEKVFPIYSEENFLSEVYMDGDSYDTLVELIRIKKNVILQGAPGVGKTFTAKESSYDGAVSSELYIRRLY